MDPQSRLYASGLWAVVRLIQKGRSLSGRERNCVFLNTRGTRFADCSQVLGLGYPDDGRGLAVVDWDQDGDLDLWFSNRTGPRLRLMINRTHDPDQGRGEARDFVALRLRGRTCNRDAIGARVAVVLKDQRSADSSSVGRPLPLIQTLSAGDGYVSQSSKWLHFGLGVDSEIDHVVVHWPGGEAEIFIGIGAGQRWLLNQGSGKGIAWRPRVGPSETTGDSGGHSIALRPSEQPKFKTTRSSAVLLPIAVPSPVLRYRPFESVETRTVQPKSGPLLLNLWATWCLPCLAELKELTVRQEALRAAGVDVLALAVDGIDMTKGTQPSDAKRVVEKLGFPFGSGEATPELLDKLQLVLEWQFQALSDLGVPTSFLLDEENRVAAIYRGPVDVDRLLSDVKIIRESPEQAIETTVPMGGTWHRPSFAANLAKAIELFQERYPDEMLRYQKMEIELGDRRLAEHRYLPRMRKQLEARQARAHYRWGFHVLREGKFEEAIEHFEAAIRFKPDHVKAIGDLGVTLLAVNRVDEAVARLRSAVAIDPEFHEVRHNLGVALDRSGQAEEAILAYRAALNIEDHGHTHHRLGKLLASRGGMKGGIEHLQRAVRIQPDLLEAYYDLGHALGASGQLESAASAFQVVVEEAPDLAPGHFHLGATLSNMGRLEEAARELGRAAELAPTWPQPLEALSLVLCAYPQTSVYDPIRALELAERAVNLTKQRSPMALASLAAAQAATGEMAKAMETSRRSIDLAKQSGAGGLAEYLSEHLSQYEQGRALTLSPGE